MPLCINYSKNMEENKTLSVGEELAKIRQETNTLTERLVSLPDEQSLERVEIRGRILTLLTRENELLNQQTIR